MRPARASGPVAVGPPSLHFPRRGSIFDSPLRRGRAPSNLRLVAFLWCLVWPILSFRSKLLKIPIHQLDQSRSPTTPTAITIARPPNPPPESNRRASPLRSSSSSLHCHRPPATDAPARGDRLGCPAQRAVPVAEFFHFSPLTFFLFLDGGVGFCGVEFGRHWRIQSSGRHFWW
jgi:hypothetical protein